MPLPEYRTCWLKAPSLVSVTEAPLLLINNMEMFTVNLDQAYHLVLWFSVSFRLISHLFKLCPFV